MGDEDARTVATIRRAIADLRSGDAVVVHGDGEAALVVAAEAIDEPHLARLRALSKTAGRVAITPRRAASLGLDGAEAGRAGAVEIALDGTESAALINELADPTLVGGAMAPETAIASPDCLGAAAIDLTKLARLLPAAVIHRLPVAECRALAEDEGLIALDCAALARFPAGPTVRRVVEARLPLADAEDTRIVAFRPADGGIEHLAIVIGTPDPSAPVLARIHSECFTGDLLGSLRCDCGEQLRGAIRAIAEAGRGGVLLYLAQEGRGIGLVNKLRAYRLQDDGRDTIDANEELGFEADERVYVPAAEMLRQLGFDRVRLMTNNPLKVASLARHGIAVIERVPHVIQPNDENRAYLATKAKRSGHLF